MLESRVGLYPNSLSGLLICTGCGFDLISVHCVQCVGFLVDLMNGIVSIQNLKKNTTPWISSILNNIFFPLQLFSEVMFLTRLGLSGNDLAFQRTNAFHIWRKQLELQQSEWMGNNIKIEHNTHGSDKGRRLDSDRVKEKWQDECNGDNHSALLGNIF